MDHARLDIVKWLALLSMLADHFGKAVWIEQAETLHFVGRLALPLFAVVMAQRLAINPELAPRYVPRLLVFGALAQPAWYGISEQPVGNIMFTLALGVLADAGVQRRGLGYGLAVAAVAGGVFVEYGPEGVALVPALAWVARRDPPLAAGLCGPLGFLANAWTPLPVLALNTGALLAGFVAHFAWTHPVRLRRLNRWLFYGVYPAHLWAFYGLMHWRFS